ncbi:MAG: hypothetical protein KBA71_04305 [Opitutaceae bacterium]|nr:hypothetical protein [Opitutaceae bacterium]
MITFPSIMRIAARAVAASLLAAACVRGDAPARKQSPFLPPEKAAAPAAAAPSAYEFTGVIVAGKNVTVNITDVAAKRSVWVAIGKSADGIDALSYDTKAESVVVRIADQARTLLLKKPAVAAVSGAAIATVAISPTVPLPPPSSPAEAEREARMLVSDLLEIGIQQRKAYEEAQRKATEAATRQAAGRK